MDPPVSTDKRFSVDTVDVFTRSWLNGSSTIVCSGLTYQSSWVVFFGRTYLRSSTPSSILVGPPTYTVTSVLSDDNLHFPFLPSCRRFFDVLVVYSFHHKLVSVYLLRFVFKFLVVRLVLTDWKVKVDTTILCLLRDHRFFCLSLSLRFKIPERVRPKTRVVRIHNPLPDLLLVRRLVYSLTSKICLHQLQNCGPFYSNKQLRTLSDLLDSVDSLGLLSFS